MKILVTGASGFIGSRVCSSLSQSGHELVALSRDPGSARQKLPQLNEAFAWDASRQYAPLEAFEGVDEVIHLAGESVVGRWSAEKKRLIYDTRVQGSKHLLGALEKLEVKPKVLISASASGYYGDRGDEPLTESSAAGSGFLAQVCQDWEAEALKAETYGLRVVILRLGIVLGPGGGALRAMLLPAKLGLNGPLGTGKQWWSWVHLDDVVGVIQHALHHELSGPFNVTAPQAVRQQEFAKTLGNVLKRPSFLPAPSFVLKLVLGEFSSELLSSKRVLPSKAQDSGYEFKFPSLKEALTDCYNDMI